MSNLLEQIQRILLGFDDSEEKMHESDIQIALRGIETANLEKDENSEFIYQAETMAFGFCEDYHADGGWGTYYGPMVVLKNEEGQWVEGPSIQLVTPKILSYWVNRANECKNPLLKLRYADLVWDFSSSVTGKPANYTIAYLVIDSIVSFIAKENYKHPVEVIKKLKRGLHIALGLNDESRIDLMKSAMMAFEDKIAQDNLAGLWGFSFDELLDNKKISISDKEKRKIIKDMEARLERITSNELPDTHSAQLAAIRLAQYYRKLGRFEDFWRVLRMYGESIIKTVAKVDPLAGSMHVENLYNLYYEYGMKEDADKLTGLLRELGEKSSNEMKSYSHEFTITKDEIENLLDYLTDGEAEQAFHRIALYYLPNPEEIRQLVIDLSKEAPLQFLIPMNIVDWEGRSIAKIGPIESDLEGRVINHIAQQISFSSVFLRATIDRLHTKFSLTTEFFLNYLFRSAIFVENHRAIISAGIKAYFDGDHVVAAHVLIPQIEHAIRYLLKLLGRPIYKPGRNGALYLRTLDELLRDEGVINTFGERGVTYLRVLLTDQRGLNLRNDVCHSTLHPDKFSWVMTDRIFHVFLLLALVREKHNQEQE